MQVVADVCLQAEQQHADFAVHGLVSKAMRGAGGAGSQAVSIWRIVHDAALLRYAPVLAREMDAHGMVGDYPHAMCRDSL